MKRQHLKFLIFLLVLGLLIAGLLFLEEVRNHPDYAPMFSGLLTLPALWFVPRPANGTRHRLRWGSCFSEHIVK